MKIDTIKYLILKFSISAKLQQTLSTLFYHTYMLKSLLFL